MQKDQRKRAEKDNRERRNRDQNYRESELDSNRDFSMLRIHDKRKSARKVEDFRVNTIVPPYDDKDALRSELVYATCAYNFIKVLFRKCLSFIFLLFFIFSPGLLDVVAVVIYYVL